MSPRRILVTALAALLLLAGPATGPALAASSSHVSFTQVQQQFECVLCHEPLNEARSDEAYTENGYLRQLIAQGDTLPTIKREMVSQYGEAVLADPPAHGFNLLVFIIPGVVILLGLLVLGYTIPRWRRRAAAQPPPKADGPAISESDAARLDADLARQG